jgi:integrase
MASAERGYTVAQAVTDWLDYGLPGRNHATVDTKRILATQHVIPSLGARKLVDLSADEVDQWLVEKAASLSSRTVADLKSILRRAITRAQSRDKVRRNVVLLCGTPTGQSGRPSKALTLEQAQALVEQAGGSTMGTYVLMSLLTGARTEELRALTWSHLDLNGQPGAARPAARHGLALSSHRRRHQDSQVPTHHCPPGSVRRCAARTPRPAGEVPLRRRRTLDRQRPRVC